MMVNIFLLIISTIYTRYIIIPVPRGMDPGATCRYYGYSDVIGSTQNISELYNILNSSGYRSAFLAAYNGGFEGYVMTTTGAVQPYNKYSNPTRNSFCELNRLMKGSFEQATPFFEDYENVQSANEVQPVFAELRNDLFQFSDLYGHYPKSAQYVEFRDPTLRSNSPAPARVPVYEDEYDMELCHY